MYSFDAEATFQYVIWSSSISNTKVNKFSFVFNYFDKLSIYLIYLLFFKFYRFGEEVHNPGH